MTLLREKYFKTLKLGADELSTEPKSKREKALDRAYELRTFEIEHYWKRATYFWAFQVAIFAAFGLFWRDACSATNPWSPVTVALSGLGVLTAFANYFSAKGSTFWQNNWELHIDMLEDEIEGRLYKSVWLPEGRRSFSVSKVNQKLSCFFIVFWVFVASYVTLNFLGWLPLEILSNIPHWLQFLIIFGIVVLGVWNLSEQKSRLHASRPKPDGSHGDPFEQLHCWDKPLSEPSFIRRYAPDEPDKGEDTKDA